MEVHIGNRKGRIAVWLDEQEAHDMAAHYGHQDGFSAELIKAIDEAYPPEEKECSDSHPVPLGGNRFRFVHCTREKGHVGMHSNGYMTWPR